MSAPTLEDRLARLELELQLVRDKQEIYDVLMRYCRGVDRGDADLIASTQRLDTQHPSYDSAFEADAIVARLRASTKATTHFFGNVLIDVNGDTARSESYFFSFQLVEVDGNTHLRTITARYLHQFERDDARWFVTAKDVAHEWNRVDEMKAQPPGAADWPYGSRSSDDPSYSWCGERLGPHSPA